VDNFEARYRAIVEKEPILDTGYLLRFAGDKWVADICPDGLPYKVAVDAIVAHLSTNLPDDTRILIGKDHWEIQRYQQTPIYRWDWVEYARGRPAESIVTTWEIILGIKEKA